MRCIRISLYKMGEDCRDTRPIHHYLSPASHNRKISSLIYNNQLFNTSLRSSSRKMIPSSARNLSTSAAHAIKMIGTVSLQDLSVVNKDEKWKVNTARVTAEVEAKVRFHS